MGNAVTERPVIQYQLCSSGYVCCTYVNLFPTKFNVYSQFGYIPLQRCLAWFFCDSVAHDIELTIRKLHCFFQQHSHAVTCSGILRSSGMFVRCGTSMVSTSTQSRPGSICELCNCADQSLSEVEQVPTLHPQHPNECMHLK